MGHLPFNHRIRIKCTKLGACLLDEFMRQPTSYQIFDRKRSAEEVLYRRNQNIKHTWQATGMIPSVKESVCKECGSPAYRLWYPKKVELVNYNQVLPLCNKHYYKKCVKEDDTASFILLLLDRLKECTTQDLIEELVYGKDTPKIYKASAQQEIKSAIKILVSAGLVESTREANRIRYSLIPQISRKSGMSRVLSDSKMRLLASHLEDNGFNLETEDGRANAKELLNEVSDWISGIERENTRE